MYKVVLNRETAIHFQAGLQTSGEYFTKTEA